MIKFGVSEEKERQLRERMAAVGLKEEDLEEKFVRSSGAGGQHVNKTSTCVQLLHRPTGIEVKCMMERSQAMNRFFARREMVERLEERAGIPTRKDLEREKLRKQKARRKRKSAVKYEA